MSSRAVVTLGALGLLAVGCGAASRSPDTGSSATPVLMYTCCTAATGHRVYHPGDVVTLHWVRSSGDEGRDKAAETLKARLDGPFRDAAHARGNGMVGGVLATGRPVKVPAGKAVPVSDLRIPANAKAGLYRVTTSDIEGPGTLTTKTVIRVVNAGG